MPLSRLPAAATMASKRQMRRGEQLRLAAAVVDQFAGAIGDPDEARIRKHGRRAVADLVVELAADQQDDVGLGHRGRAHGGRGRGMIGRDQTAALLRVEIERAGCVEQPHQRGPGLPCAAAGDDDGSLRRPERVDRLLHRGRDRAGWRAAASACIHSSSTSCGGHMRAQHVGRHLEIDRPGLAHCRPWRAPRPRRARASPARRRARCARCASPDAGCRRAECPAAAPYWPAGATCSRRSAAPARGRAMHWRSL